MSSYVEAHHERLMTGDPVVTWTPSRAPLIAAAARSADERGWFSPTLTQSGDKAGAWFQHGASQAVRLSRTIDDWHVRASVVAGRSVVLFDDVFVTGASMYSYAAALRDAGATAVRGIAIGRHIQTRHFDYRDAARIERLARGLTWFPERSSVYQPEPPA